MATPSKNKFQIGWICALPIEAAAAIQMLDENFGILQEQERSDTNTYTLGRIGRHHVVIACLPDGQYGTTSATTVAINMMRTFSDSLRIGLMVGIGGGAPSAEHDIRLGDIIVSRPEGSSSGVIQHDLGKIGKDGEIKRIGSLNSPPKILLNALTQMRAAELYDDPQYPCYLQEATGRNKRTRKTFSRPDNKLDRLFKIEHVHLGDATSCDRCSVDWEEDRFAREDSDPRVHYGTIASGNTLIKDGKTREAIRKETGALCFEMEAAGLMADFPCLVIRGICDYADSHKNHQWQSYAALAAAALTKELLGYVPKAVSQESLVAEICPLLEDIKKGQKRALDQQEINHHEKMMKLLSDDHHCCHQAFKTSTYEKFKNINPNRVKGTCEWVLNSPEYLNWWKATNNSLLWISADPGCGKSVLAKSLIDEVFMPPASNISILYFFFKDNDEQNKLATALCAILHQLFALKPQVLRHAIPSWERNREKVQHEVDDMWRIFMTATSDPTSENIICIFDALDECRDQDQKRLIGKFRDIHDRCSANQGGWVKFLVTSRPYDDIQDRFRSLTESFPQLHLRGEEQNDQIRKEINLVVQIKVAELTKDLSLSVETQKRLTKELIAMKHRTYLWLHLAIDDIKRTLRNSFRPDQEAIPLLPKNVSEAYERILDRVTSDQKPKVKLILRIIVGARRPLSIREMAMALGVATSQNVKTAIEACLEVAGLDEKIRQLCGLLVFIKDSRIYLIHQTARDFLLHNVNESPNFEWYLQPNTTEVLMTEICVRYLLMDDLITEDGGYAQSLLDYSAENWPDHFRKLLSPEIELVQEAWKLYDTTSSHFNLWFTRFWKAAMPYHKNHRMKALHVAAFNGHQHILWQIAMSGTLTIDEADESGRNALQWACLRGFSGFVHHLLKMGADANAHGGQYSNGLYTAATGGHVEIVHRLLEAGANVNAQGGQYGNALQAAATGGHFEIVHRLLEAGAHVNAQGGQYGNALQAAAAGGHVQIIHQLLDRGANVNARGGQYDNALYTAATKGRVKIIHRLLEAGADVCVHGGKYGNALEAAAAGGYVEIARRLIEAGANVNAQGGQYGNALQAAAAGGHVEIVHRLLKAGADANAQCGEYGNALQAAVEGGYSEIVHRLLEAGANVNARGGWYDNALYTAAAKGYLEIVHRLLEEGASVNAPRKRYGSALQAAASAGHLSIVHRLIEAGANVNARRGVHGSAIYTAASAGYLNIVHRLLEAGAKVNTRGGIHGNALQGAVFGGHLDIVQRLLEAGAEVNALGGFHGNALQAAAAGGRLEIVRRLLEAGAKVNAQGGQYGNALQAAAAGGHLDIVQRLLEAEAEINTG